MELENGVWFAILTLAAPTGWEGSRRVWRIFDICTVRAVN